MVGIYPRVAALQKGSFAHSSVGTLVGYPIYDRDHPIFYSTLDWTWGWHNSCFLSKMNTLKSYLSSCIKRRGIIISSWPDTPQTILFCQVGSLEALHNGLEYSQQFLCSFFQTLAQFGKHFWRMKLHDCSSGLLSSSLNVGFSQFWFVIDKRGILRLQVINWWTGWSECIR